MRSLAVAAFDAFSAPGEEMTVAGAPRASLGVCTLVFFVVKTVAVKALVDVNKAFGFQVVGGDRCIKHHESPREKFLGFLGG